VEAALAIHKGCTYFALLTPISGEHQPDSRLDTYSGWRIGVFRPGILC
jgi:hypothetical protein